MAETVLAKMAIQIAANTSQFNTALSNSEKKLNSFTKNISTAAKGIVAGFGLVKIATDVIAVTSEFQKFEAVLTNTLGDNSKAQKALADIKDFAVTTPFEVSEVTAAYVRWANQGLSPTIDRMKKLGDIGSSLGAGFEQTAEAFKDLAVGQTKRIEEIGISAQQANGKIQLSFKGVNIEIEKNAEGVQKALDIYSQLNGVLGTSDAVSLTLGGRISNLKDSWDSLMLAIGNGTSGPLFAAVESLTRITTAAANLGSELDLIEQALNPFHDLRDVSKETLDYLVKMGRTDTGKRLSDILKPFQDQSNVDFLRNLADNEKDFYNTLESQGESLEDINVLWDFYVDKRLRAAQTDKQAAKDESLQRVLAAKAQALAFYNLQLELNIKKEKKAAEERAKLRDKRLERGTQVLLEFSQTDLTKLIAQQITAFRDAIKQHEEDFKITVKYDDNEIKKLLPKSIKDIGDVLRGAVAKAKQGIDSLAHFATETEKIMINITGLVSNGIANLADALGTALGSGDFKNFGKGILEAVAGFAQQLGALMISAGVAEIVLETGNPAAMIVAGAALVAAGAAIKSTLDKKKTIVSKSSSGSTSRSSSEVGRVSGNGGEMRIDLNVTGKASGRDLVYVVDNYNVSRGRTG